MNKPGDNYFYELLTREYNVEFSDKPDIVFYSCFGNEHLKYTCTRIFFSPENYRPDRYHWDYAITSDYINDERHLRMPLWALYYISYKKNELLQKYMEEDSNKKYYDWINKKHFCCIMVSNENAFERIAFYKRLNDKIKIDSAGRWNNTIGRSIPPGTENKFEFIKDYRFVISFENSAYPGYCTEKIVEPLLAGCIPVYWGDPDVHLDFNVKRFINVCNTEAYDEVIDRIVDIENNKQLAAAILEEPMFPGNTPPVYIQDNYVREKLYSWVEQSRAKGFKGMGGNLRERIRYYTALSKSGLSAFKKKLAQRKLPVQFACL